MAGYTTFRIGGPAQLLILPQNKEQLAEVIKIAGQHKIPVHFIGNGSNLLAADGPLELLAVHTGRMDRMERTGAAGQAVAIENDFFGHTIDVAGLITGGDLIAQLKGRDLGARLLIPVNMLRHGGDVFLDDLHVSDVEKALGIPVTVVEQDGFDLLDAMLDRK